MYFVMLKSLNNFMTHKLCTAYWKMSTNDISIFPSRNIPKNTGLFVRKQCG